MEDNRNNREPRDPANTSVPPEIVPPFAILCLLPPPVLAALDIWRLEQPGKPSREQAAGMAIANWLLTRHPDLEG